MLTDGGHVCASHGVVAPLWRPREVGYDAFADVLMLAAPVPTYLPWPMIPGWTVSDFGCVSAEDRGRGTVTRTVGSTELDGPVEVTIVSEDPGVGLGAHLSGTPEIDPGSQVTDDPPAIRVRTAGRSLPLWPLDLDHLDGEADPLTRSAFVGESDGRWLWMVVRPAPAALLLRDEWLLADVAGVGPEALDMPFGGDRGEW